MLRLFHSVNILVNAREKEKLQVSCFVAKNKEIAHLRSDQNEAKKIHSPERWTPREIRKGVRKQLVDIKTVYNRQRLKFW